MNVQKANILVVEDNLINQRVIVGMLKKCGFVADVAENGLEAIEAYDKKQYDLILMDCEMPEMDGFEATMEIRRKEKENNSGHVPIVALTAHAFDDIREQCLASGMDEFLTKPLQLQVVQDLLQEQLPGMLNNS